MPSEGFYSSAHLTSNPLALESGEPRIQPNNDTEDRMLRMNHQDNHQGSDDAAEDQKRLENIARQLWEEDDDETTPTRQSTRGNTFEKELDKPFAPMSFTVSSSSSPSQPPAPRTSERHTPVTVDVTKPAVFVQNPEPRTTKSELYNIFFPMGASSVELHPGGGSRRSGIVYFSSASLAQIAAAKINNFVPHGQTLPLTVTFVSGNGPVLPSPDSSPSTVPHYGRSTPPASSSAPSSLQGTPYKATPPPTARRLELSSGGDALRGRLYVSAAPDLTPDECFQFFTKYDDTEAMMAELLSYLSRRQHRGISLCTGLIGIVGAPGNEKHRARLQEGITKPIIKNLLAAGKEMPERIGCAIVTATLFDFGFIGGSPFAMAKKLITSPMAQTDSNLVDAVNSMTSAWASRHPNRIPEADEIEYRHLLQQYYENAHNISGSTEGGHGDAHSVSTPETTPLPSSVHSTPDRSVFLFKNEAETLACTVYVTRIPATTSESKLRSLFLEGGGELNKVRLYEDSSNRGAFGFVEFSTPAAARDMIEKLDRRRVDGATIRCSAARSAIHEADPRDAIVGENGERIRPCLFGLSPKPQNLSAKRTPPHH